MARSQSPSRGFRNHLHHRRSLVLLAAILPLLSVSVPWLGALGYVGIAVALAVLALGGVNSTLTKVLLIAAAVG